MIMFVKKTPFLSSGKDKFEVAQKILLLRGGN